MVQPPLSEAKTFTDGNGGSGDFLGDTTPYSEIRTHEMIKRASASVHWVNRFAEWPKIKIKTICDHYNLLFFHLRIQSSRLQFGSLRDGREKDSKICSCFVISTGGISCSATTYPNQNITLSMQMMARLVQLLQQGRQSVSVGVAVEEKLISLWS